MPASSPSITFRIPEADREALDRLATERGVHRADLFREAVSRVLAESADEAGNGAGVAAPSVELGVVPALPDAVDPVAAFIDGTLMPALQRIVADFAPTFEQFIEIVRAVWDAVVALTRRGVAAVTARAPAALPAPPQRAAA